MRNSFSPQTNWLRGIINNAVEKHFDDETVIVHHVTAMPGYLQLEVERRRPSGIVFDRIVHRELT